MRGRKPKQQLSVLEKEENNVFKCLGFLFVVFSNVNCCKHLNKSAVFGQKEDRNPSFLDKFQLLYTTVTIFDSR